MLIMILKVVLIAITDMKAGYIAKRNINISII